MLRGDLDALQGIDVTVGRWLGCEEGLEAIAEGGFFRAGVPPVPVDRPVAGDAPGVVAEDGGLGEAGGVGSAVPVGVDGGEGGHFVGGFGEELAAGFGGLGPKGAVFGRTPAAQSS